MRADRALDTAAKSPVAQAAAGRTQGTARGADAGWRLAHRLHRKIVVFINVREELEPVRIDAQPGGGELDVGAHAREALEALRALD